VSGSSSGAEPRRIRRLPALLAAAHAGSIWWLSSQSFKGGGEPLSSFLGNSFHLALFGLLAILLLESCRYGGGWTTGALLTVLAITVGYGVIDELHQTRTAGRSADAGDVCVDFLAGVGAIAFWWGVRGPGRLGVALLRGLAAGGAALAFNAWRAWGHLPPSSEGIR